MNQKCQVKVPIRVEECSFEYSKAEDLPTYLLNESSIDQLIADIDLKKSKNGDQQFKKSSKVPKLQLEKISEIKRENAKMTLKNVVLKSIDF